MRRNWNCSNSNRYWFYYKIRRLCLELCYCGRAVYIMYGLCNIFSSKKQSLKRTAPCSFLRNNFSSQSEYTTATMVQIAVADPGFPVGGGRQLPRRLRFEKFVCQNERIWTLRGARSDGAPWIRQ